MSPGAWRSRLIGILKRHKDVDQRNACDYGEHDRGGRVQQDGQERKPAHDKANANTAEATRMICGRNTKNSTARMIPPAIVIMVPLSLGLGQALSIAECSISGRRSLPRFGQGGAWKFAAAG